MGTDRSNNKAGLLIFIGVIISVIGIILVIKLPGYLAARAKAKSAWTKSNLHHIQIELERYSTDHDGQYPEDTIILISDGYLSTYPTNPYTKQAMKEIEFGTSPFEGEFSYFPYGVDSKVYGFYMVAYGAEDDQGQDIDEDGVGDHVIITVESGIDFVESRIDFEDSDKQEIPPFDIPSLAELARAQKEPGQQVSTVEPENIE